MEDSKKRIMEDRGDVAGNREAGEEKEKMRDKKKDKTEYLLLLAILFIGIILRVPDLEVIPTWQWDEGTNQNIAWNLAGGRLQWYCLTFPFVPHPPLFFIVVSLLFKFFPSEIIVMRYLCVSYGIAAILVIHWIGKRIGGAKIGLMSAFLFSIYPSAIYWNRMGFANNQLMLLILLTAYFTLRYMQKRKERWLYLASFSCGLSIITEYVGVAVLISQVIFLQVYGRRNLIKFTVISLIPLTVFVAAMLYLMPSAFIHDIAFQFERYGITLDKLVAAAVLLAVLYSFRNYLRNLYTEIAYYMVCFDGKIDEETKRSRLRSNVMLFLFLMNFLLALTTLTPFSDYRFIHYGDYFWFGLFGLFFIAEKRERNVLLIFAVPLLLTTCKIFRVDHMWIPLYPLFCIGLVFLLREIYGFMRSLVDHKSFPIVLLVVLCCPFPLIMLNDISSFIFGVGLEREDRGRYMRVAGYVDQNTGEGDFILTDPYIWSFSDTQSCSLLQGIVINEVWMFYMAKDYGFERFAFNCSYRNARFVVIEGYPALYEYYERNEYSQKLKDIKEEITGWPHRYADGYFIYENPAHNNTISV